MASSNDNDPESRPTWVRRERSRLYLVAVSFALLGFLAVGGGQWVEDLSDWWSKALSEVGIAFIIAGLLLAGSEWYLKESFFAQMESNISELLQSFRVTAFDLQRFGRMPSALRERLRDRILDVAIVQHDVTYRYQLEKITLVGETVYKASVEAQTVYENISVESQRFTVKESLQVPSIAHAVQDYGFHRITSEIKGKGDFPEKLVPQVIRNHVSSSQTGTMLFTREAALDSGAELHVTFEGITYFREDEWISLEAFRPTIDMVCVTTGQGLEFSAQTGDALSDIWSMTLNESGENSWELRGAILPGQGIDIWFESRKEQEETLGG